MSDHNNRPDLELERLVMGNCMCPGCDSSEGRPAAGWSAREGQVTSIEAAERHEGTGKAAGFTVRRFRLEEVKCEGRGGTK